ncbi:ABC transporter permease [Priestia koreensis]|uniref:ABC transporter permease n=1 Tax=Priestia koreensis TaxID=284581 RepID=UPI001F567B30|nr:ABC transporter permease [Priestia koreensis]UNL86651.1 ABC transporter permease [Priestia koreensis]
MMNLIRNEQMKLRYKTSTIAIVIIILAIAILGALLARQLFVVGKIGETTIGYLIFSTTFLSAVKLVLIPIAGTIVSTEFDRGTIKFLLIRPAKRSTVLLSKYITILLVSVYGLLLFFVVSFIVGLVLFPFKASDLSDTWILASRYGFQWIEIIVVLTIAFTVSTVFRNGSLAIGITLLIALVAKTVSSLFAHFERSEGKYLLFSNVDLSQYFRGSQPLFDGMTLPFSIFIIVGHMIFFLALSWYFFVKRDVSV